MTNMQSWISTGKVLSCKEHPLKKIVETQKVLTGLIETERGSGGGDGGGLVSPPLSSVVLVTSFNSGYFGIRKTVNIR